MKDIVEVKCQAHSTALVKSTVSKELQLTSLADKISTTLGNIFSKGSLFKAWKDYILQKTGLKDFFQYRKGVRWRVDFKSLHVSYKHKENIESFLIENIPRSKQGGQAILDLIRAENCLNEILEIVNLMKLFTDQLWKVFGVNQPIYVQWVG